jgi:pyrroline-5-carboxylate reductase
VKLGLIGCGFMGEALLNAAFSKSVVAPEEVTAAELNGDRREYIRHHFPIRTTGRAVEAIDASEVVIFAIKPQEFHAAAHELHGRFRRDQTIVSIMAGVRIETISRSLAHASIARVMPSTPAAIGEGISVWTTTPEVDEASRAQVAAILGAMGPEIYVHVEDEKYIDMATALSGSGPGFVYLLLEAFIDAGVHVGFRRDVAERLALQTFIGASKYAEWRNVHPAQLRNEVTSPGGTTAAGLQVLEEAGVRGAIIAAIEAAYERSRELGAP